MSYNTITTKEEFLTQVVLPIKSATMKSNSFWHLRDLDGNFILSSDALAIFLGYTNGYEIQNKNLYDLPYIDQNEINDTEKLEYQVKEHKSIETIINTFKINNNIHLIKATIVPIIFRNKVVAIDTILFPINQQYCDLELFNKTNYLTKTTKKPEDLDISKTPSQRLVLFLLILGKTQMEIAKTLNISRARVTFLIARMCENAMIPGSSSKLLISKAIVHNYHKKIPQEFFEVC